MTTGFIATIAIIVIVIWIIAGCIKIVPQAQAFVIERLGGYKETWSVGLHFKMPLIDKVAKSQTDFHRLATDYLVRYGHRLYRERIFLLNIQVITTRAKTKQGGCHTAQYHYLIKYLFHFSYGFSHYKMYLIPKPYWVWKCFAALPQRTRSRRHSNRTTLSER